MHIILQNHFKVLCRVGLKSVASEHCATHHKVGSPPLQCFTCRDYASLNYKSQIPNAADLSSTYFQVNSLMSINIASPPIPQSLQYSPVYLRQLKSRQVQLFSESLVYMTHDLP